MKRRIALVAALCILRAVSAGAQLHSKGPVSIDSGLVSGVAAGTNGLVSAYKGIPYASPPIGELRWRPPAPAEPWEGVRAATEFGPAAPQRLSPASPLGATELSEDCLYLNVWTPADTAEERLPVMVWIHGGGFRVGSGSKPALEGTRLAEAGVVVVTFNYRLNVFGSFAHPLLTKESGHGSSGNYGLMDQIAALEWVRRNIAVFGGDPDRVTIFGQSAGGRSVSVLMVSPLSKGLFHRAIGQSGSLCQSTGGLKSGERQGERIAAALGCDNEPDPLAALRLKTYAQLVGVGELDSNPIVDGWVVPDSPEILYGQGKQHDVPMIVGSTADEASGMISVRTIRQYDGFVRERFGKAADQILASYPVRTDDNVRYAINRLGTNSGILLHARNQVRWMKNVSSNAYFYHFTRVPPCALGRARGAYHCAEIPYVFGNMELGFFGDRMRLEDCDRRLSDAMMGYWTQFAKTGNPNRYDLPEWPAYDGRSGQYLELSAEIKERTGLRKNELDDLERIMYR